MTTKTSTALVAALSLGLAGVAGAQAAHGGGVLVGAGSTLVAPLVGSWQGDYQRTHGVTLTYGAIGSGGGIAQITARTIDFAGSDAPLSTDQKAACKGCVLIPWALAGTTIDYNVSGVSGHIRLSGPVLGDIYLGKIKEWNDPQIAKLNRGLKLPGTRIQVIYRSDASGDTYAFTDYLSKASPAWKVKEGGASTEVSWPTGTGGKGNAGMAALISQTPGAIGYVAIAQTKASKLSYALIRNKAGAYPNPSTATIAAAGATATFKADNSVSIVDPPASAKNAYPISTFTYAIVPRGSSKLSQLKAFLSYAVSAGQRFATALSFAPLPSGVATKDKSIVRGL